MPLSQCKRGSPMTKTTTKLTCAAVVFGFATTLAIAHHEDADTTTAPQPLASIPDNNWTMSHWLKQTVYDMGDNKIGDIKDVLLDHDGKASAVIIGIGGFLGVGERDVAVPYASVRLKPKDEKWYLVLNTSKDALETAQEFTYE